MSKQRLLLLVLGRDHGENIPGGITGPVITKVNHKHTQSSLFIFFTVMLLIYSLQSLIETNRH